MTEDAQHRSRLLDLIEQASLGGVIEGGFTTIKVFATTGALHCDGVEVFVPEHMGELDRCETRVLEYIVTKLDLERRLGSEV